MTAFGCNSEYAPLAAVLLYQPSPEVGSHPDPAAIQHLRPIDYSTSAREYAAIKYTFAALGIAAVEVDPAPLSTDQAYRYNMMYCRDLQFMTPAGAILASMANATRREEVRYAERTLVNHGIPVIGGVSGSGRFEGADALWLNERLVVVGVGHRTNGEGFEQVNHLLRELAVECVALPSRQTRTQHLLGSVQIVDRDLALMRSGICDPAVGKFLENAGFTVVEVPENEEVTERQAMNIVTIAPRTIIMTAGCHVTKALYRQAGLTIAAELEVSQLINGAGGLACATGILARKGHP